MTQKMNRRKFLALAGSVAGAGVMAACATPTPQVIEKVVTQVVEKETIVEKKVEVVQTKEVIKEVQKEVVKQITPTPGPKLTVWIPKHFIQVANDFCTDSLLLAAAQNGFSADVQAFPWGEYNQKQAASIEAKNTPDLCLGVDTVRYQALGVLQDVGDVFKEVGDSGGGFFPDRIAQSTIGGKVYSVPFHAEPQVMYYRKDVLKEQGLEKPPVTMAEFLDFAKKATQPDKKIWGWGNTFSNAPDGNNSFYPWMWAYGARMQDKTGKITVNSPETLEALTAYCDMYTKHKVMPPGATGWDDTGNNKAWLSGQMASIFNSGSIIWTMRTTDTTLLNNTMFGPVPGKDKEGAKGPSTFSGGNFYGIFTFTKFAEQAKKMIKGSLSPARYPGQMNAANGMFYPVMKNYISADIYKNDQWNAQVVELTKVARNSFDEGEPAAWIGEVGAQWLISQMTSKVVVDGVDPKKALDDFEKKVIEIQAKYKK